MKALLGLALLACTVLALPAVAEETPLDTAGILLFAPDFAPRIEPICPFGPCECTPRFICTKEWDNPPSFIRQKDNGKCVYLCSFTETCRDTRCNEGDQVNFGTQRMRIGPYPLPDGCPDEAAVTCPNGEMLPPGVED